MSHLAPSEPNPPPDTTGPGSVPTKEEGRPTRPGWIEIAAAAVGFGVFYLIAALVLPRIPADQGVAEGLAAYALSALVGLAAFFAAMSVRIRRAAPFGVRRVKGGWLLAGAGFGVVAFVLGAIASLVYRSLANDSQNVQAGYQAAATGGPLALIAALLLGAVATPIGEELAFRGVLANALERYGAWVAVVGSAIVFAFAHGINPILPVAFIEGLIAALLFHKTRSVWPGVLVHLVNNSLATLLPVLANALAT